MCKKITQERITKKKMTENEEKFYKALKEAIYYGKLIGVDTEGIGLEELERRFKKLKDKSYIEVSD